MTLAFELRAWNYVAREVTMPFSKAQAAGKTLYCCICREASCRRQWAKDRMVGKLRVVACARHTDAEFSEKCLRALARVGGSLPKRQSEGTTVATSRWEERSKIQ